MAVDLLQARAKLRERLLPDIDDWVKKKAGARVEAVPKSPAVTSTFITSAAPSLSPVSTPGVNNSTPSPTPQRAAVNIVVAPEPKVLALPSTSPSVVVVNSTPAPTPQPTTVKVAAVPEPKATAEPAETPEPNTLPSAVLAKTTPHLPLAPVSTPTPLPQPLSMIQSIPRPIQPVVPEPSPTLETMPTPSATPVASPSSVESTTPRESPKAEENSSDMPSPTAAPEPSPTVQKRAIARHSATPKPKPTPTPTPKPKTIIGQIFESLRKANEQGSKTTPTPNDHYALPTPTVRYWATPNPTKRTYGDVIPNAKSGKASASPTP